MTATLIVLGCLLLLPGLLVVRAPWTVVPALSLAFWTLSIWWPPLAGLARSRVVAAGLLVSFLLLLLRLLPKHEVAPPPGWTAPSERTAPTAPDPGPRRGTPPLVSGPALAIVAVALALVATTLLSRQAPGADMAFQTTSARLLLWRDGVPRSAEPLLPLAPFGAYAPALATIAADLAALSGSEPARAVLVVFTTAVASTLLGLFFLWGERLRPAAAVLAAVAGLTAAWGIEGFSLWGTGEAVLCLGLVLPAATLTNGHASRSSGFAAGLLWAAGLLAQPLLAAASWACCVALLLRRSRWSGAGRVGLVSMTAVVLGGPGLAPALQALSGRELAAIFSPRPGEVAACVGGCLALVLAGPLAQRLTRRPRVARATLLASLGLGVLVLVPLVHGRVAHGQLPPARRQELLRLAAATGLLDVVCAPPGVADWIPALAGRAVEPEPWIPAVYRDEWVARQRRSCRVSITER